MKCLYILLASSYWLVVSHKSVPRDHRHFGSLPPKMFAHLAGMLAQLAKTKWGAKFLAGLPPWKTGQQATSSLYRVTET